MNDATSTVVSRQASIGVTDSSTRPFSNLEDILLLLDTCRKTDNDKESVAVMMYEISLL
jgi:hypothetical protein